MTEKMVKEAIASKKMKCPECGQPIQKWEKFSETVDRLRDGFNITEIDSYSTRVTLTCGNGDCPYRERTEYWANLIED